MYYFGKSSLDSDTDSKRYISVNNFGYGKDIQKMNVCRKNGRSDYQLLYIKSGRFIFCEDDEEKILNDGSIYLYRPNEPQKYRVENEISTYYWIHFSGFEAEKMLEFFVERSYKIGAFP